MNFGKRFDEKVSYNLLTMYSDCDGTLLSYLASKWFIQISTAFPAAPPSLGSRNYCASDNDR